MTTLINVVKNFGTFEVVQANKFKLVLKGKEKYVDIVTLSLHYNFMGVKHIKAAYKTNTPFDDKQNSIIDIILLNDFTTPASFLTLLNKREAKASKILDTRINEYRLKKAQLSLF
jgi:hypothetical protein